MIVKKLSVFTVGALAFVIDRVFLVTTTIICDVGSYWNGKQCKFCPAGTYGATPGLSSPTCTGKCAGGYFCPEGSTSEYERRCGRAIYYCPVGSSTRQTVARGYYSTNHQSLQLPCEKGYYCIDGVRYPCPAGYHGDAIKLYSPNCLGKCRKGTYCPPGSSSAILCPPGTYGEEEGLETPLCSGTCPQGHYCVVGTVDPIPCPAGFLGNSTGLVSAMCSKVCSPVGYGARIQCRESLCPSGYYCPMGSIDPLPCGGLNVYCPEGSSVPLKVSEGYYTWSHIKGADEYHIPTTDIDNLTHDYQEICPIGYYCTGGIMKPCPEGVYSASNGLSTPACTAPCPVGNYCPLGTSDTTYLPCMLPGTYCRGGSSKPTPVSVGYYVILGGVEQLLNVDEALCPLGHYCINGKRYICPKGSYGSSTGLSSPKCSGLCAAGYQCPPGSVSQFELVCPAGTYSLEGQQCEECNAGYWCTQGSTSPTQNQCGSDFHFCPQGSSEPHQVKEGYYAVGQTVTTHVSQELCRVQLNAGTIIKQCPSHTVGAHAEL